MTEARMNGGLDVRRLEETAAAGAAAGLMHGMVVATGGLAGPEAIWHWGEAEVWPRRRAMRPDSIFDVASVTKVIATATAVSICAQRGLVDPDAPAVTYLPGLGELDRGSILVRDLATHGSGFDNQKFPIYPTGALVAKSIETSPKWPVGTHYEYSCRNYITLSRLVEQVSGEEFRAFCRANIFEPVGMVDTDFAPLQTDLSRVVASEQPAGVISDPPARNAGRVVGNAGMFTTAADLARYSRMILRGGVSDDGRPVLGPTALGWMMQPCSRPGLVRRSLGWEMGTCREHPGRPRGLSQAAIGHGGWTGQSLWIDPDRDVFTIVLTNRDHAPVVADNYEASRQFRARVAEILLNYSQADERG